MSRSRVLQWLFPETYREGGFVNPTCDHVQRGRRMAGIESNFEITEAHKEAQRLLADVKYTHDWVRIVADIIQARDAARALLQRAADKLCHYATDYPQPDALKIINDCDRLLVHIEPEQRAVKSSYESLVESAKTLDDKEGAIASLIIRLHEKDAALERLKALTPAARKVLVTAEYLEKSLPNGRVMTEDNNELRTALAALDAEAAPEDEFKIKAAARLAAFLDKYPGHPVEGFAEYMRQLGKPLTPEERDLFKKEFYKEE